MHLTPIEHLHLTPPLFLSSPHIQTILGYIIPCGLPPPSQRVLVKLNDGDFLSCDVSTPINFLPTNKTIILLHGLGGSQNSPYMIRLSRKFYELGFRVVRVNMRGCGPGKGLTSKPYHGGLSQDVLSVVKKFKETKEDLLSPITLIGFSLGGNIVLKLAGEYTLTEKHLVDLTIAVCPPVDLAHSSALIARKGNRIYNTYYMNHLKKQGEPWLGGQSFSTLYEFDCLVTAPQWGFKGAFDYYQQCSSRFLLQNINHPCRILFSADDPFIDYKLSVELPLPECIKIGLTNHGGHLGFMGWAGFKHYYSWMDYILIKWIQDRDNAIPKKI